MAVPRVVCQTWKKSLKDRLREGLAMTFRVSSYRQSTDISFPLALVSKHKQRSLAQDGTKPLIGDQRLYWRKELSGLLEVFVFEFFFGKGIGT